MKIEAAFRPLRELERGLADLYGSWAEAFEDNREAALVFFKMATEEKGHAALIDYARRFVQKDPALGGDIDVDLSRVRETSDRIRHYRESEETPSLERALEIALEFEEAAAESHYRTALKQMNPEMERLLQFLGSADEQHVDRLKEFSAKLRRPSRVTKRSPAKTSTATGFQLRPR